ncbi:cobalt-precorrin-6A reductase [Labrys monachus]|uniref:Precorrin-6A/cobalt-precorrin-6A reductase n=1 Tax=Labrys monachus TaxID=217067 RepID=A0ABU0FD11_9HYPH|nr:cobalt-precorrin-6A reductase [Labrys monachus]MDQ0392501.1 precorrin-6A/cobalt-precorrin-6A reductase [Labrys monachus]
MHPIQILILGGTSEAAALARLLAGRTDIGAMISLAGRTKNPAPLPIPHRIGGFGGPEGLAAFLAENRVAALVDATHPFADRMSANAVAAARMSGVPLLALRRPAWQAQAGDRWTEVADAEAAVAALGARPRRVFLTTGRLELPAFLAAPQHFYLVRSVDAPEALPPLSRLILARGPFAEDDECALMQAEGIEAVVTKNSGGTATYGKIAAARRLGLPVILLRRPAVAEVETVSTAEEALAWIERRV